MKQNSRKNETMPKDSVSLDNKEQTTSEGIKNSSHHTPGEKAREPGDSAAAPSSANANEVTRAAEGRPGSFGIDDF
ncbi:MAG: hypothetical protein JWQ14_1397 [Adhaeribacter sp.]|nr:hypothetical protein [Adhaeribacter sp.]